MRLTTLALIFFGFCNAVLTTEPAGDEPRIELISKPSVYNVGEKKAMYCRGYNIPERIVWLDPSGTRVDVKSSKNTRVFVEYPRPENFTLSLVPVIFQRTEIKDSGNWTCKVGDLQETVQVIVGDRVSIPNRSEQIEGEEGKLVRLNCVAKGIPAPVVQWYKYDGAISEDKKYHLNRKDDNHQLEIRSLTHLDAGEYVCKVTQEALSYYIDKRVQLSVKHKPIFVNPENPYDYSSRFKTEEVYAVLNDTKNITCSVLANPMPTYRWTRKRNNYNEDLIPEDDTVFTAEDGSYSVLMLRMYNESNLGEYQCSANNSRGVVSVVFHVTIGNKPEPPDYVELVKADVTKLTFNVTCSSCNLNETLGVDPKNLRVINYSFQFVPVVSGYTTPDWDKAKEYYADIIDANDTLFTVDLEYNNTEFYGRVRSTNSAGYSEWLDIIPNPVTTAAAFRFVSSITILTVALLFFLY